MASDAAVPPELKANQAAWARIASGSTRLFRHFVFSAFSPKPYKLTEAERALPVKEQCKLGTMTCLFDTKEVKDEFPRSASSKRVKRWFMPKVCHS